MRTYGPLTTVNYKASGVIPPYRVVAGTTTDGVVAQSVLATNKHVGVSGIDGAADGERIDITHAGIVPIEYGGNVAFGDLLSCDTSGRAIVAAASVRAIGVAMEKGDSGTIGSLLIAPCAMPA